MFLDCLLAVFLFVIFLQDIKYRAIHFALLIAVFIISLIKGFKSEISLYEFVFSSLFLSLTTVGMIFYFFIKNKKFINPINKLIGIGDILFFIAVLPLFSSKSYVLFFITGMLFSIIMHLITLLFKDPKTIPLAGFLSVYLVIIGLLNSLVSQNLFNLYF